METKLTQPGNKAKCGHLTTPVVVSRRPFVLSAGSSGASVSIRAARLVLAGDPKPVVRGLPGFEQIIVKVEWPDMGIPAIDREDWQWLVKRFRGFNRPLHVNCAMGHGRTGTCLAILGHFLGIIPGKKDADPVAWVRSVYCPEAIETRGQITYVETVTGRTVMEPPRPPSVPHEPIPSTYGGSRSKDPRYYSDPGKVQRMGDDLRGWR